jgi:hypothetical protein
MHEAVPITFLKEDYDEDSNESAEYKAAPV